MTIFTRIFSVIPANVLAFIAFSVNGVSTSAAGAMTRDRMKVGVLCGELMAVYATRFTGMISRWAVTTQTIVSVADNFQVQRAGTISHFAKMIGFEIVGDYSYESFIREPVRRNVASVKPKPGIPASGRIAFHQPARGSIKHHVWVYANLFKETRKQLSVYGKSVRISLNHLSLRFRFDGIGRNGFSESLCLSF